MRSTVFTSTTTSSFANDLVVVLQGTGAKLGVDDDCAGDDLSRQLEERVGHTSRWSS
jgi:hypothetical protein